MTPLTLTILSILVGLFPLFVSILASSIAKYYGCNLDEGGITNCDNLSKRAQKTLYSMFVLLG